MATTATTFKQYAKAERDRVRSEYGITVAEANRLYPDHMLRPRWMKATIALAAAGGDVPRSVARTMTEAERYAVTKFGYSRTRYV